MMRMKLTVPLVAAATVLGVLQPPARAQSQQPPPV